MTTLNANKPNAFCDPGDLDELLDQYYASSLDRCDDLISRLYLPIHQLHPSNALLGQLSADEVADCLEALPPIQKDSIEYFYKPSADTLCGLLHHFYQICELTSHDFDAWLHTLTTLSVANLGSLLLEAL